MDDLLTTRQVQDILKVDRITVYRMLADGRLKGTKIGQQWRFSLRDVERLLKGEPLAKDDQVAPARAALPLHCIQTIQNLLADVAHIGARVVDMQGEMLTQSSGPGETEAEAEAWRGFVEASRAGKCSFASPSGLEYTGAPILDGGEQIGLFLVGPFLQSPNARPGVPIIAREQRAEVESWPAAAVRAIHSVLHERTGFVSRLQQIADLTQLQ